MLGRDASVEVAPAITGPRAADRNIALNTGEKDGFYRPSQHLGRIREQFEREGKNAESFVRSHVRRLEALHRAGHVERLDDDHWQVPGDIIERGQAYDRARGGDSARIKTLASRNLEQQIGSDAATWNMCPRALERAFRAHPAARAVIVVHIYGLAADMDAILEVCRKHRAAVIEDAAEALGTLYKGRHVGTFGDCGALSFNGNKIITTSGGGMLVSDDSALAVSYTHLTLPTIYSV